MLHPITLETTRAMDKRMLILCPLILIANIAMGYIPNPGDDLVRTFAINAILVELLAIYLPAYFFIEKRGGKAAFGLVPVSAGEWAWALLFGVAACFLSSGLNGFTQYLWQLSGADLSVLSSSITVDGGWRLAAMIFLLAIVPPIAEETLFRGALLHAWLPRGKTAALWHTAVLFALVHLQPQEFPALLLLGLFLGAVTLMTGSVYPAMAIHGMNNLMVVLLTYAAGTQAAAADAVLDTSVLPYLLLYVLAGAAGCFACYKGMKRASAARRSRTEDELMRLGDLRLSALRHEQDADAAPVKADRAPVVWTYVIMGLINVLLLAAMFLKLPAGLNI